MATFWLRLRYLKADGTVNNLNGFGTVNGSRDPRIMQLVVRLQF